MPPPSDRLKAVFDQVAEIAAAGDRAAFLDRACDGDPDLRGQVEALLRAAEQAGSFLEHPPLGPAPVGTAAFDPGDAAPPAGPDAPPVAAGTVIAGRYKLLEEIGEGGMGAVWLAEQTDPVRRRVAVKLIKPGMDTCRVVARFEAERQALALMDHPNIARVLDGGATPDGRPYFVMELVKGIPITRYCDERRLGLRDRLGLFADVCRAVQHAHQKGVIHRDLKPANVLVAPFDGAPVVKVIDFGVAKATGEPLTERTLFTGLWAVVGTPEYMSPEQAEVNNRDVDTRSDIYSLGVLLYELLTGTTPLTRERVRESSLLEVLRLIREEEPPRPSTRLSETTELPAVAAARGVEPARLPKVVRGDLDWIVMKALEKDRNRRYETANGLAADVARYLADEPVTACPPSAGYRVRKFVRRNRGAVLAASLVLLALVGGVIGTTWQAVRAARARAGAEASQRESHEAVNKYYTLVCQEDLLNEPALQPLRHKLLQAALDYYRSFVRAQRENPELQAELAATCFRIAILTYEHGAEEDWVPWFEEGVAAVESLVRGKHDLTAIQSLATGQRWVGVALTLPLHDRDKTLRAFDKAREVWEELDRRYPDVPGFQNDLAAFHHGIGALHYHLAIGGFRKQVDEEKAWVHYSKSCEIYRNLADAHPDVPQYKAGLALVLSCMTSHLVRGQKTAEAERTIREALATVNKLIEDFSGTPGWLDLAGLGHQELGYLLEHAGRLEEAEAAYRQMLACQETLRTTYSSVPRYRQGVFRARLWLGEVLWATGRRTEAEDQFRQALKLADELNPKDPVDQNLLAWFLANSADPQFRNAGKSVELAKAVVGLAPEVGDYWMTLGAAHYRAGDHRAAAEALERAVRLPTEWDTNSARFFLAMAHWQLGQKDRAQTRYREGVEQMDRHEYRMLDFRRVRAEAGELLGIEKE